MLVHKTGLGNLKGWNHESRCFGHRLKLGIKNRKKCAKFTNYEECFKTILDTLILKFNQEFNWKFKIQNNRRCCYLWKILVLLIVIFLPSVGIEGLLLCLEQSPPFMATEEFFGNKVFLNLHQSFYSSTLTLIFIIN